MADPEYARAYAGLAMARANNTSFQWAQGPEDSFENAIALAKKAVNNAPDDQFTHRMYAGVLRYRGDFDQAIEAYEQALARSPSNPDVLIALAFTNALAGHGAMAVQYAKTAMRLNPYPPPHYFSWQGISYYVNERFEEAANLFEQFGGLNPKFFLGYFWTALGQAQLGNMSSAELQRQELLRLRPDFTIKTVLDQNQAKGVARKLIIEGARKAGIPEIQSPKLPDKPSIAVLPFDNMSNDPQQEYFSDGITEDLITDLSQVSGLFVIARNSTFTYKGKFVNVQQVGRELGVRYVVEGSIRKQGDRVRINAQLIDVQTGGHLWAQRYDRNLTDVFALQDEVVKKIVSALAVTLNPREQEQLAHSSPVAPEAYDKLLRGLEKFRRFTAETNLEAREYFELAIAIDPAFTRAHDDLALTYAVEAEQQWTNDPERSAQRGLEIANHALTLDNSIREVHFVLSIVYRGLSRFDESIMAARKAINLSPNYADGHTTLALSLNYAGSPQEGLAVITRAMKLNPLRPFFYVWTEGQSYYLQGNYEKAVQLFEHVITTNPQFSAAHKMLVATYIELGRKDDAEWAFEELLTISPEFRISTENIRVPYSKKAVRRRYIESLRQAKIE